MQEALEWPDQGNARVPYRVFADPDIYRTECERIFLGASWQYLALANELPRPGDYRTNFLGETPIIVVRGEDGEIHAMVNRCAHRGNLVCLKERGHSDDGLTCVYHSWRYDLAGNLQSVAFRRGVGGKGGMPESFRLDEHGLKKLRTDQFAGLVFGTLSPDAPPLSEYLGNLIGSHIGRVMHGKPKILGTTSQILHNNWKLYVENVKDTYHASLLHTFFTTFRVNRLTNPGGVAIADDGAHHCSCSYTYGGKPIDQAASDTAYAGIQSLARITGCATRAFSIRSTRSATASRCKFSAFSRISCCSKSTTRSRCGSSCRRDRTRPNSCGPISALRRTMRR
jgi:phenylpropionate dioxygenase-like ring-hydroxylating dioxygenase large terminal subunit